MRNNIPFVLFFGENVLIISLVTTRLRLFLFYTGLLYRRWNNFFLLIDFYLYLYAYYFSYYQNQYEVILLFCLYRILHHELYIFQRQSKVLHDS